MAMIGIFSPLPWRERAARVRGGGEGETFTAPIAWLQVAVIAAVAGMLMLVMGGVHAGPRAIAGVAVAGVFLLSWSQRLLNGPPPDARDRAWLWVWLALSVWIGLQLLPLPRALFDWIGAYPSALLAEYPQLPVTRLSPNPAATIGYWAMFTTYWATAWLVSLLPCRQLGVLVGALVALIFTEALYGFAAHVGRFDTVLGLWEARGNHNVVLGTFWNRNHLAGLLALGWSLGIGFLLYGTRRRHRRVHEFRYLLVIVYALVLALALFNTQSRLGTMAGLFGLLVFVLLARSNRSDRVSRLERVWLLLAGLIALGLAITFGLAPLLARYVSVLEGAEIGRLDAWATVFALPAKTWLAGAGAGAFEDVFKLVQPPDMNSSYVYLHNDGLQFLLEFGLLGTGLVLIAVIIWWRRVRPNRFDRLRAAAAGGIAAIALHSLGDFNLQIPGTAFAFWVAVGVLCNNCRISPPHPLPLSREGRGE